jgi:hypothetical protein
MNYQDGPNIHPLGASGAYGDIPSDQYLRKIEATPFYEDPDQLDNHYRSALMDFRSDPVTFASDEAREDTHAKEFLGLRYGGSRSGDIDPYLPDGTFLDWEFTERDKNPYGPDMREHVKQQFARAAFIKFYDDSDYSVPESGITPVQMVANIASGRQIFKDYYKNFDESMDAWHNGGTGRTTMKYGGVLKDNTLNDGTIVDLADSSVTNRSDATTKLSNDPSIAFRNSTVDHRFKTSKYGMVRANQALASSNWGKNRGQTYLDDAKQAEFKSDQANKRLAALIVDLQGQRNTRMEVAKGANYEESAGNLARKGMRLPDVQVRQLLQLVNQSHAVSAHEAFDGQRVIRKSGRYDANGARGLAKHVQINHEIVESMAAAGRRLRDRSMQDLREKIEQSAADEGVYREGFNNRSRARSSCITTGARNAIDQRTIEESKTIYRYSGIQPTERKSRQADLEWETFGGKSRNNIQRKGRQTPGKNTDINDTEFDIDQGRLDFGIYDHADKIDAHETYGRNQHQLERDDDNMERLDDVTGIDGGDI